MICYLMIVDFADIDECERGEHNCNQTCSNTLGSFECSCTAGYTLQGDGATCAGMHAFMSRQVCVCVCVCVCVRACVYCKLE